MSVVPNDLQFKLSSDQLQNYRDNGFLVLRNLLTEPTLSQILAESMAAWNQEKSDFDPQATWLKNSLLPNIHHRSPATLAYYFHGPLVDIVQQLIGPNIKGATSQLTFKLRGNTKPFGWHQDNGYGQLEPANAISTLTALDDADEENGCLWILPRSHLRGQIDVSDRLTNQSKAAGTDLSIEVPDADQAIPIPVSRGDVILFHCHTLHRSDGNSSSTRDRRILFLRYADADAVEVYNHRSPRLGPLLRGTTQFKEVEEFEAQWKRMAKE